MYQKEERRCEEVINQKGDNLLIKYYLITGISNTIFSNESPRGRVYGICIELYSQHEKEFIFEEVESVQKVTYNKTLAMDIIDTFANLHVVPMELIVLIDEMDHDPEIFSIHTKIFAN